MGFKASLANELRGVEPSEITLELTSASVHVRAIIMPDNTTSAQVALSDLNALAVTPVATLSTLLHATVESVAPPTYQLVLVSTAPPPSRGSSGMRPSIVAVLVVICVVIVPALLFALHECRKRRGARDGANKAFLEKVLTYLLTYLLTCLLTYSRT